MNNHNQCVLTLSRLTGYNAGLLKAACQYIESTPCEPLRALVNLTVNGAFHTLRIPWYGNIFHLPFPLAGMMPMCVPYSHDRQWRAVSIQSHTRIHSPLFPRIPSGWRNRWQWKVIHTLLHVPHAGEENPVSALVATNHSAQIPGDSIALCWGPAKTGLLSTFYSLPAS